MCECVHSYWCERFGQDRLWQILHIPSEDSVPIPLLINTLSTLQTHRRRSWIQTKLNSFSNPFSFTIEGEEVCSENWYLACLCFLFDIWPSCPSPPRLDTPKMRREDSTNSILNKWVRWLAVFTNCFSKRHFNCTVNGKRMRECALKQYFYFRSLFPFAIKVCNCCVFAGVLICFSWAWWHVRCGAVFIITEGFFLSSWVRMWWN